MIPFCTENPIVTQIICWTEFLAHIASDGKPHMELLENSFELGKYERRLIQ